MHKESDAEVRITRIVAGLLNLQLARISRTRPQFASMAFDDFTVGYIFGFVDVMTQRVGIVDRNEALRIFAVLAKALFGHETGEVVCARFRDRQDWPEAVWGASTGRSDSRSWLKDPTIPPVGWYQYFRSESLESVSRRA